jgi:hypothetical protein
MEMSGQLHSPAALSPGKEPLVPIGEEAGWARAGLDVVVKGKIRGPSDTEQVTMTMTCYACEIFVVISRS